MKRVTYYLMKGSENDGYYFKPGVTNEQGRERIGLIEDILGDNYDLEHLRKLVQADREGRCVVLPMDEYIDKEKALLAKFTVTQESEYARGWNDALDAIVENAIVTGVAPKNGQSKKTNHTKIPESCRRPTWTNR